MAKSGSFYTNVGKHWRLQGEWNITQSVSSNSSTITLKTYWVALDKYGAIYSYVKKTTTSSIGGTKKSNSLPNAALNPNQKKLINTQTITIKHNADGTHSGTKLSISFGMKVWLSDVFYDTRSASKTVYFNTIPQKSSITSKANFTAGNNLAVTISRKASSFKHKVTLKVGSTTVASASGVGAKVTLTPDKTKVFTALGGATSKQTTLTVETMNGSKSLGSVSINGTCTSPSASTLKSSPNFTTGNSVGITITRVRSDFTHTVKLTVGSWSKSWTEVGTSVTWNPTTAETENIQKQITKKNTGSCTWTITTYCSGQRVRSATTKTGTVTVNSSGRSPLTTASGCYGYDNNASVVEITGSNRTLIQNKSSVYLHIPANIVTPRRNSTFSKYVVSVNGRTFTYSTQVERNINVGLINKSGNVAVTITGYDSRGNTGKATFNIRLLGYKGISVIPNGKRAGGLSETVSFLPAITYDIMVLNGVPLQNHSDLEVTINNGSTTTDLETEATGQGKAVAKHGDVAYTDTLSIESARTYTITVTDIFNSQVIVTARVQKGIPSLYIDEDNPQISVGKFPEYDDSSIEVAGGIRCKQNGWYYNSGGTKYDKGYAGVDLNNSDLIGANSLAFADNCGKGVADTEGILFPNTGTSTATGGNINGMTKLFALDGVLYLSDYETNTSKVNPIALADVRKPLWSGASYMHENQKYTPSRSIYDCPNGWCLAWSRYDGEAFNDNWSYTYIHKYHSSGGGIGFILYIGGDHINKYVYVQSSGTVLAGHTNNNNGDNAKVVLRYILAW